MTEKNVHKQIFNSAFETGLRTLCALSAGYPNEYDIQQLLALDHIIVHSSDMPNGPASLHPQVKQRNGELLVRRPLVQKGLSLMEAKGLISTRISDAQIFYVSTDLAPVFLDSLTNPYIQKLIERADWAVSTIGSLGSESLSRVFNTAFDRWTAEFQISDVGLRGTQR